MNDDKTNFKPKLGSKVWGIKMGFESTVLHLLNSFTPLEYTWGLKHVARLV